MWMGVKIHSPPFKQECTKFIWRHSFPLQICPIKLVIWKKHCSLFSKKLPLHNTIFPLILLLILSFLWKHCLWKSNEEFETKKNLVFGRYPIDLIISDCWNHILVLEQRLWMLVPITSRSNDYRIWRTIQERQQLPHSTNKCWVYTQTVQTPSNIFMHQSRMFVPE